MEKGQDHKLCVPLFPSGLIFRRQTCAELFIRDLIHKELYSSSAYNIRMGDEAIVVRLPVDKHFFNIDITCSGIVSDYSKTFSIFLFVP